MSGSAGPTRTRIPGRLAPPPPRTGRRTPAPRPAPPSPPGPAGPDGARIRAEIPGRVRPCSSHELAPARRAAAARPGRRRPAARGARDLRGVFGSKSAPGGGPTRSRRVPTSSRQDREGRLPGRRAVSRARPDRWPGARARTRRRPLGGLGSEGMAAAAAAGRVPCRCPRPPVAARPSDSDIMCRISADEALLFFNGMALARWQ
jgi:hypothetical protein